MKTMCGLILCGLAVAVTGCVTVAEHTFCLDCETGMFRREYHDLTSRRGPNEKDYSITNDWAALKELVETREPEYDPDVVEEISKTLFETNGVLCGRKTRRVKCPKCFPSKAAVLSFVHEKDWRFEVINGEVVLFLPSGKAVISTNGRAFTTAKNSLIFWPQETNAFEYVVSESAAGGASLLPYFRGEQKPSVPANR